MKILVVGASSFTGKHFCAYAREEKGATVVEASLRQWSLPYFIENLYYVVNFSALNVVAPSWEYPLDYLKHNVIRTHELMQWIPTTIKKYVHVSTPEVYGSTSGIVTEDHPYYNPSTPYAVSRAAAEMMLLCYHKQYGFPVVFTRGVNVYGPGQQLYRLIPKVVACIKKGIKFPLEGGGTSFRSFVHVRDTVDAIWRVMIGGTPGEAYHISRGDLHQISWVARQVCINMGVRIEDYVEKAPERKGKDDRYELSSAKIRSKLEWEPTIDIYQGIKEVVQWMESNWDTLKDRPMEYVHRA